MKYLKISCFFMLFLTSVNNTNAQFLKKLQKKIEDKVEKKVEDKIDKETDKVVDSVFEGKKINQKSTESNLPNTINFTHKIHVKITANGENETSFIVLTGNASDVYGIELATDDLENQGSVITVVDANTTTTFINANGMKIRQTSNQATIPVQHNTIPENANVDYNKTGATKTILGYLCEEYTAKYSTDDFNGTITYWVSNTFPIQNKNISVLGMVANHPQIKGFVMQMQSTYNNETSSLEVVKVENKTLTINTNEYQKM